MLQETESLRGFFAETSESELAAFSSYALSFPTKFQALVDTFDVSQRNSELHLLNGLRPCNFPTA
jgi:hypothetical protein